MKTLPLDASAPPSRAEPRRSSRSAGYAAFDGVLREAAGEQDPSAGERDEDGECTSASVGADGAAARPSTPPPEAVAGDGASSGGGAGAAATLLALSRGGVPLLTPSQVKKLESCDRAPAAGGEGVAASGHANGAPAAPGAGGVCIGDGAPAVGAAPPTEAAGVLTKSPDRREVTRSGEEEGVLEPARGSGGADAAPHATLGLQPPAAPPDSTLGASVLGAPSAQPRDPGAADLGKAAPGPLSPPDASSADGAVLRNAAHLRVEAPGLGELELHLRVRDGVAHVRIDGEAAPAVEARAAELSRALASEGLKLGQLDARQAATPTASSSADAGAHPQRGGSGRERHEPAHVPAPPATPQRAPAAPATSRPSSGRYTVRA